MEKQIQTENLTFDFKLFTAFSRQGPTKVYVQHLLAKEQESIWKFLEDKKGLIYVCGYVSCVFYLVFF